MNKFFVSVIVVVAVVAGYIFFKSEETLAPSPSNSAIPISKNTKTPERVVVYNESGYSPNTLTIKAGETVTFKNESSRVMWTASSGHPSHVDYSGSSAQKHCPDTTNASFDSCAGIQPGNSWQFTFTKKGAWEFHNHLSPSHYGSVTVE